MFGSLGLPEIILILVLALLIFGPKRLPEMGRTIGKGLSEFRRASTDFKRTVNAELALDEGEQTAMTRRPDLPGSLPGGTVTATTTPPEPAGNPVPAAVAPPAGTTARGTVEATIEATVEPALPDGPAEPVTPSRAS